jgi:hypothetical protein
MNNHLNDLKSKVIYLRKKGKTYRNIQKNLNRNIPKSTLSYWCKNIVLSEKQKAKIENIMKKSAARGRIKALEINKIKRKKYLESIKNRVGHLGRLIKNKEVAKIALAMIYLGEGSKTQRGSLMLGNSDPDIIRLFLYLLRNCYNIDESKFRCTLQARADQHIKKLERFWSTTTKIPLAQFYKARIDPRTIGKISKKIDYKGVCRIDYFSADTYIELMKIAEIIHKAID